MRIEDAIGTGVAVIPESASGPTQSRLKPKKEITLEDLKLPDEKKKAVNEPKDLEENELKSAVENANKLMDLSSYHLKFKIDEESNRTQVKLIDNETQEVIREVPPERMLELSAHIKQVLETVNKLVGVFVDEIR